MRHIAALLMFLALVACDGNGGFSAPPSKTEAAQVIKQYLKTKSMCDGVLDVKTLDVQSIDMNMHMGGWKVLSNYVATCRAKNSQVQYLIANYTDPNFFEIYVKSNGAGWYEAFIPDEIRKSFDGQMKKMMDKIHVD